MSDWLPLVGVISAMLVAVLLTRGGRSNSLDALNPLPAEELLFEDEKASYGRLGYNQALVNSMSFLAATVRCTNRRIIIAQKALFSRQLCIMFVIYYGGTEIPQDQRSPFPFVSFAVSGLSEDGPGQVQLVEQNRLRFRPWNRRPICRSILKWSLPVPRTTSAVSVPLECYLQLSGNAPAYQPPRAQSYQPDAQWEPKGRYRDPSPIREPRWGARRRSPWGHGEPERGQAE